MGEKLQSKNVKIVLFFVKSLEFNSVKLASTLMDKIPELGQPNIINVPDQIPVEIRMQTPKISFNFSKDMSLTVTDVNMTILINKDDAEFIKNNINLIYEALKENNIDVQAIGVVSQYLYCNIDFNKIKTLYYKEDELQQSDLINMSWYKKENNMNIWKTFKVDEKDTLKNLTIAIDVNNKGTNELMNQNEIDNFLNEQYKKTNTFKQKLEGIIGE